jgi:hypothetical protein
VTGDDGLRKHLNLLYEEWGLPTTAETPVAVVPLIEGRTGERDSGSSR